MVLKAADVDKDLITDFKGVMANRVTPIKLFFLLCILTTALYGRSALAGDYRTVGILAGVSFPKDLVGKIQVNISESFAVDYQPSIGILTSIQQADVYYFFNRNDWSPYLGLGLQAWSFIGISSSTTYSGLLLGSGNSAMAATVPFGLFYLSDTGFAFDISMAADIFTSGPSPINGKVIPEAQILLGYFF